MSEDYSDKTILKTYQSILHVSGNGNIYDGTGSLVIAKSASYAEKSDNSVSASYALTSLYTDDSASISSRISGKQDAFDTGSFTPTSSFIPVSSSVNTLKLASASLQRYNVDSSSFNSNISNRVLSSVYSIDSGSFSDRITVVENVSSSLSYRVTKQEASSSKYIFASASFQRYNVDSGSFNTNIESRLPIYLYLIDSQSFNNKISSFGSGYVLSNQTSSMSVLSASYAQNVYVSSSGQDVVLGNVIADTITANQYNIKVVSSSVLYSSGSTKFGDTLDDLHSFTGSLELTGSIMLNGTSILSIPLSSSYSSTSSYLNNSQGFALSSSVLNLDQTIPQSVINGAPTFNSLKLSTSPITGSYDEGKIYYGTSSKSPVVEIGNLIKQELGQQLTRLVYNNTGTTLLAGQAVRLSTGGSGNVSVAPALASGIPSISFSATGGVVTINYTNHGYPVNSTVTIADSTDHVALPNGFYRLASVTTNTFTIAIGSTISSGTCTVLLHNQVLGLVIKDIPTGSSGHIIRTGLLYNVDTSMFSEGSLLYLSDTVAGGYIDNPINLKYGSLTNKIGSVAVKSATVGQIYVYPENENRDISITSIQRNILDGNMMSTGVYEFSGITTNVGDPTHKVDIPIVRGWIINNTGTYFSTTPSITSVNSVALTAVAITNIATADATYFLVNDVGTVYQQTTKPTPQERRDNILLGKVVHPNRSTIQTINNTVDYDTSPMSALRDMFEPISLINDGITCYPDGANLGFNTTAGSLYGMGINWPINQKSPNKVTVTAKLPASFYYRTQTGGSTGLVSLITPGFYDNGGTITALPSGNGNGNPTKATNKRIYMFSTGMIVVQYGQKVYGTLALALAGQQTETFVKTSTVLGAAILVGILAVTRDCSDLNDTTTAIFTPASIFGESVGGVNGISTTTLQQSYNNSTTPEIITNSLLGALSVKRGSAVDTDSIFEGVDGAGIVRFSVNGNGDVSASIFTSTVSTGTAPLIVNSTTLVPNLHVSLSETSSYLNNNQGFVLSSQTSSISILSSSYSITSSYLNNNQGFVLSSQTSSIFASSASYSLTSSLANNFVGFNEYSSSVSSSINKKIGDSYETVSQNLRDYPKSLTYLDTTLLQVTHSLGGSSYIYKSFTYSGSYITTASLSGDLPSGIKTKKILSYNSSGSVIGINYI